MKAQIGISQDNLTKIAHILNEFLADEFVLYLETKNAHWNTEGADFLTMHKFFEGQYEQLDDIIDELAERIRALGHYPSGTLKAYLELTHLSEQSREKNNSAGFIKELLVDHESVILRLRANINTFANELSDVGTSDFITDLMEKHEKMAWVLRAHLK